MNSSAVRMIIVPNTMNECGCCIAGCGVSNVNPRFVGAAGMNRIARFALDPRDTRTDEDWFEVVSSEDGVFGCIGLMACQDVCPKGLPLREVYAFLRRKMLAVGLGRGRSSGGLVQIDGGAA